MATSLDHGNVPLANVYELLKVFFGFQLAKAYPEAH